MAGTTEIDTSYLPSYLLDTNGDVAVGNETEAERISQGIYASVSEMPPTEQIIMLSLLKTHELAEDEEQWTTDTISATLALLAEIADAIADYFETAGGVRSLTRVLIENMFLLYTDALQTRLISREISRELMLEQAHEKRKEGRALKDGAIVSLCCTLAMCFASAAMAANSFKEGMRQATCAHDAVIRKQQGDNFENVGGQRADDAVKSKGLTDRNSVNKCELELRTEAIRAERLAQGFNSMNESWRAIIMSTNSFIQADSQKTVKEHEAKGIEMGGLSGYQGEEANLERDIQAKVHELARYLLEEFKTLTNLVSQDMGGITRNQV